VGGDHGLRDILFPKKMYVYARVIAMRCCFRTISLLVPVFLCSCGAVKKPLTLAMSAHVKTIELARIEVADTLVIRRLNPVFAIMGSSGMVLDSVLLLDHAYEYKKRAGSVNKMCVAMFTQTLAQELTGRGYQLGLSQQAYWDYYKKSQKEILARTDAIFRIRFKQMGFWSRSLRAPFVPSLLVQAELIDPVSRNVLYASRFAMGLDVATLKIVALGSDRITLLPEPDSNAVYQDFSDLLKHPEQSREALLAVVAQAAHYIAKGFRNLKPAHQPVFVPRTFDQMPKMPRSDVIGLEVER